MPVLVDAKHKVIAGHGRILACQLLGWTEVPTICLDRAGQRQRALDRLDAPRGAARLSGLCDQVKGTKFERSQPFRSAAEAGNIKLLHGAWNAAFLEECEQFSPEEREYEHDDQIDAAAAPSTT